MSTLPTPQPSLSAFLHSRPIAIERSRLPELFERSVAQAARIASLTPVDIEAAVQAANDAPLGRMVGSVAVLPIRGCITQKADFYSWFFGGTSIERLTMSFRQYMNDPAVSAIVFDVDSPGGEVYGLQECFKELIAARGEKKTFALVNPFMASAAYFLGCAAEKIWMTPSGQVGSIGCYTMHVDLSQMLAKAGVNVTFIQYGENKTNGNPYQTLSDTAQEELQESVNFYGTEFDKAVATGRGVRMSDVKAKFGQGKMFRAPDAKAVGLIDVIGTRDELLAKLAPARQRAFVASAPATAAAAESLDDETRLTLDVPTEPAATASATTAAKPKPKTVDPDEHGECPDGYDKGEDGQCHLPEETKATAAEDEAQVQADADAIAAALALTESC